MEDKYPGLWQRWFRNQCVAVGWPPQDGYRIRGGEQANGWPQARNALQQMSKGDLVIVQLRKSRVGRIGEVVRKRVGDNEWDPLVPKSQTQPYGEMGRRILVRWDLNLGPSDPDRVIKLPKSRRLPPEVVRSTVRQLDESTFKSIVREMKNENNWVSLLSQFVYETSLSDYIAAYPHRLEDDLQPFASAKVRERVFSDRSRSDVLLIDKDERPVVVECKQHAPTVEDLQQLRHYMKLLKRETRTKPRGILVHGGARKLGVKIRHEMNHKPRIEVVQYSLIVDFAPCK